MRQTLFFIPHEVAGIPLFGSGWALICWAVLATLLVLWMVLRQGWNRDTRGFLPFLLIVAALIYFVLPMLEVKPAAADKPIGLPIRGYGVMLLLGVSSGIGLAVYRARQVGIHPDVIYSLAFLIFLLGIGGARLFYVVQHWDQLNHDSWQHTLLDIVRFTEGGLVVYGSLLGALVAFVGVAYLRRLRMLRLADIIAPSMLIGLAIGRIGCLLNGCCFGGICETAPVAIQFPQYSSPQQETLSPAYAHQLSFGQLHGFQIGAAQKSERPIVEHVDPGGSAARSGISAGAMIRSINGVPVSTLKQARQHLRNSLPHISVETDNDRIYQWSVGEFPDRSRRVHPAQIYSSINAGLLFAVLWLLFPCCTRDGLVFGVLMTVYPVTRMLLEIIRNDESGVLGTQFTVSQSISLVVVLLMVGYWPYVLNRRSKK
jgi:phosphatidylglycerol:prolipoprotein diacylglycerol transferase